MSKSQRTLVQIYDGVSEVLAHFMGAKAVKLSALLPIPKILSELSDVAWANYELLFGDEDQALAVLDEYELRPAEVAAYKLLPDVRRDAYMVMQAMSTLGVVSSAQWRRDNWDGPDREVRIHQEEPFLALEMPGDSTVAARNWLSTQVGVDYEVVIEELRDGTYVEVIREQPEQHCSGVGHIAMNTVNAFDQPVRFNA